MRNLLKKLYIIQETKKYPRGKYQRLNPYNPLSYLTVVIVFIVGIILFGVLGFWDEVETKNPFKYQ